MYDTTNLTDANNIYEIVVAVNELSNYWLGMFFLFSLFFVLYIALKNSENDTEEVLLIDCTICAIIAVLMWSIGLLNWAMLLIPIIGMFGSAIVLKLRR